MSKASEYVTKSAPLEFRTSDEAVIATVGWYEPTGDVAKRIPILDVKKASKVLITAEDAVRFGRWLIDVFGEPTS